MKHFWQGFEKEAAGGIMGAAGSAVGGAYRTASRALTRTGAAVGNTGAFQKGFRDAQATFKPVAAKDIRPGTKLVGSRGPGGVGPAPSGYMPGKGVGTKAGTPQAPAAAAPRTPLSRGQIAGIAGAGVAAGAAGSRLLSSDKPQGPYGY